MKGLANSADTEPPEGLRTHWPNIFIERDTKIVINIELRKEIQQVIIAYL